MNVQPSITIGSITWTVARDDRQQWTTWLDCRDRWLKAKERKSRSAHTRRAYTTAWDQFYAWLDVQGRQPWEVTTALADAWVGHLEDQGLAPTTIRARCAALSSFFTYAMEVYTMTDETGPEMPLHEGVNPMRGVQLPEVQAYGKAVYPTQNEVKALLAAIDLETARGWRDMAIVLGLLTMAQRYRAWIGVRWGQIREGEKGIYFVYRAKGGRQAKAAISAEVWHAVQRWIELSGRAPLAAEDPVFVAVDPDRSTRLPNVSTPPTDSPLTNATINGMLRALARKAGVDPLKVHAHGLRHAGARWIRQQGADVWDLQRILGHQSIATTQLYIEEVLDEPENPYGSSIAGQLGLWEETE